jgi:hypothetical protein
VAWIAAPDLTMRTEVNPMAADLVDASHCMATVYGLFQLLSGFILMIFITTTHSPRNRINMWFAGNRGGALPHEDAIDFRAKRRDIKPLPRLGAEAKRRVKRD